MTPDTLELAISTAHIRILVEAADLPPALMTDGPTRPVELTIPTLAGPTIKAVISGPTYIRALKKIADSRALGDKIKLQIVGELSENWIIPHAGIAVIDKNENRL